MNMLASIEDKHTSAMQAIADKVTNSFNNPDFKEFLEWMLQTEAKLSWYLDPPYCVEIHTAAGFLNFISMVEQASSSHPIDMHAPWGVIMKFYMVDDVPKMLFHEISWDQDTNSLQLYDFMEFIQAVELYISKDNSITKPL